MFLEFRLVKTLRNRICNCFCNCHSDETLLTAQKSSDLITKQQTPLISVSTIVQSTTFSPSTTQITQKPTKITTVKSTTPRIEEEEEEITDVKANQLGAFVVAIEDQSRTTTTKYISGLVKLSTTTNKPITTTELSNQLEQDRIELIMEKQRQLQQTRNWHKFLTERANLRQRAIANVASKTNSNFRYFIANFY